MLQLFILLAHFICTTELIPLAHSQGHSFLLHRPTAPFMSFKI